MPRGQVAPPAVARDPDAVCAIGRQLRRVRYARGKSLRVVAGLAGMSTNTLWRLERGERALDRLTEIVALAQALEIAPAVLLKPLWIELAGDHLERIGPAPAQR